MTDEREARDALSSKDFHILYALALGPLHGYALVQQVEERTGGSVRLEPANLYRRLHRFVEQGLIEPVQAPEDNEDARRKYYRATSRGRDLVAAEIERMNSLVREARKRGLVPERSP